MNLKMVKNKNFSNNLDAIIILFKLECCSRIVPTIWLIQLQ